MVDISLKKRGKFVNISVILTAVLRKKWRLFF